MESRSIRDQEGVRQGFLRESLSELELASEGKIWRRNMESGCKGAFGFVQVLFSDYYFFLSRVVRIIKFAEV